MLKELGENYSSVKKDIEPILFRKTECTTFNEKVSSVVLCHKAKLIK